MFRSLPLLIALALGVLLGYLLFRCRPADVKEEATVLLEQMQSVAKLITVEGQFSEIYDYNAYQGYFTWLYDKKMLVRVQGKVSVGYDLKDLEMEADPATRTMYIGPLPTPQILSIDHKLDYYDIKQGFFTQFSTSEYNQINEKAKDLIRQKAENGPLFSAAEAQAGKIVDMMRFMAESAGWKVVLRERKGVLQ
ncbi:MAG: DUF4230 domain-containing protein [Saprospiraceae bacterium]